MGRKRRRSPVPGGSGKVKKEASDDDEALASIAAARNARRTAERVKPAEIKVLPTPVLAPQMAVARTIFQLRRDDCDRDLVACVAQVSARGVVAGTSSVNTRRTPRNARGD